MSIKMNKINTFDYLKEFDKIYIKISDSLFNKIRDMILNEFGISAFSKEFLHIHPSTLQSEFTINDYHHFSRIIKIINYLNISKEKLYKNILGFYHCGSHRKTYLKIKKELNIDEFFVEGYALYFAEGDNGSNGKNIPRKFRFTNSDVNVINHMIKWIKTYFPNNEFYVDIINPKGNFINLGEIKKIDKP